MKEKKALIGLKIITIIIIIKTKNNLMIL